MFHRKGVLVKFFRTAILRSSCSLVLYKISVLKSLLKQISRRLEDENFIKQGLRHRWFPVNLLKCLGTSTLWLKIGLVVLGEAC